MFKKRKGFRFIELPDGKFQFSWSSNGLLIMYAEDGSRIDVPCNVWWDIKNSNEYMLNPQTWHGKNKKRDACYATWGKREVREAYRKYKVIQNNKLTD